MLKKVIILTVILMGMIDLFGNSYNREELEELQKDILELIKKLELDLEGFEKIK